MAPRDFDTFSEATRISRSSKSQSSDSLILEAEVDRWVVESDLCLVQLRGKLSPIRTRGHCTRCLSMSPSFYTPPPGAAKLQQDLDVGWGDW